MRWQALIVATVMCAVAAPQAVPAYRVIPYDMPAGATSAFGWGSSSTGTMAGYGFFANNVLRAIVWQSPTTPTIVTDPAIHGSAYSFGAAADGSAVVFCSTSPNGYKWTPGIGLVPLSMPSGSTNAVGVAITESGLIVGLVNPGPRGMYWRTPSDYDVINPLSGDSTLNLVDVNNLGIAIGRSGNRVVTYSPSTGLTLRNCPISAVTRMADNGVITGNDGRPWAWSETTGLETYENALLRTYEGNGVNSDRVVVGQYATSFLDQVPVMARPGIGSYTISGTTSHLDPDTFINRIYDIDETGKITGGCTIDGLGNKACIAEPIPGEWIVWPTQVKYVAGIPSESGVRSFIGRGDRYTLSLRAGPTFLPQIAPITYELTAQAPTSAIQGISVRSRQRIQSFQGPFFCTVQFYDWTLNSFSDVASSNHEILSFYVTERLLVQSNASRYISNSGQIRARFSIRPGEGANRTEYRADIDQILFWIKGS